MKKFKDFYQEWVKNTPEPHSKMGAFGEGVWDDMFYEGLITSYPKEAVEKMLINLLEDDKYELVDEYDEKLIKIYVTPVQNDIQKIRKYLNKKLQVYGYSVGKTGQPDHFGRYTLLIEPKFSKIVDDTENMELYHLTHGKFLEKISKQGLTPRESTTMFTHPGNRIYLFTMDGMRDAEQLKFLLASGKQDKRNIPNNLKYSVENMVLLKVTLPENAELYYDPMFGGSGKFKGYYTPSNIPPQNIEFIEIIC